MLILFLHDYIHIRFIIPITYITSDTAISTFFLIHLYRNLSIGNRHLNMYFPIRSRLYFFFLTGGGGVINFLISTRISCTCLSTLIILMVSTTGLSTVYPHFSEA